MSKRTGRRYQDPHKKVRDKILRLDPICSYCRVRESTTVDHIIPRGRGGDNQQENLAGCCRPCNNIKGGLYLYETDLFLHPSERLFEICAERGIDPLAYNDEPEERVLYTSAADVPGFYDTSLGERLQALGMKGLSLS